MSDKRIINLAAMGTFGDYVMLTAALPPLKYQGYEIRVIGNKPYVDVLENHPLIDHLITLPYKYLDVDHMYGYADHLLGEEANVRGHNQYWLLVDLDRNPTHALSRICEGLNVPVNHELSLHLSKEVQEWGKQFSDCVLIQTQASCSPYKNWPLHYWEKLCARIKTELGLKIMQLGAPHDPPVADTPRVDCPTIHHAFAALKYSRLFIGLDSVFNHASHALKKSSIILWNSTDPLILGHPININLVNGVAWHSFMERNSPLISCQPCYIAAWDIQEGKVCSHMLPEQATSQSGFLHHIPACKVGNSVEAVFQHVVQYLGQQ